MCLTTDNLNICEGITTCTTTLDGYKSWQLSQVTVACFLIQAGVTPFSVVTNWKILVIRYGLGSFLSGCLIQSAIDNPVINVFFFVFSLYATRVTTL